MNETLEQRLEGLGQPPPRKNTSIIYPNDKGAIVLTCPVHGEYEVTSKQIGRAHV